MSDQNLNRQPTRVVRVDKGLANQIDEWAVSNGLTMREIMDAIVGDFLSSSKNVQHGALSRWVASGRAQPRTPLREIRHRPLSVSEWSKLCHAERAEPARNQDEETSE